MPHLYCLCAPGNTFYIVLPTEQGESITDDPPTASDFQEPLEEVTSQQSGEDTPTGGPGQSEGRVDQVEDLGRLQSTHQSHVIQNVDEIFHTIEGLMSKLRQLKASLSRASSVLLSG